MLSLVRRHSGKIFCRRANYNRLTSLYRSVAFRCMGSPTAANGTEAVPTTSTLSFSSQDGKIESMVEVRRPLIPQFTLRWILALMTVMAVVSLVFNQALAGHAWAVGITILLAAVV